MVDAVCVQGKKVDLDFARRLAAQFETEVTEVIPEDAENGYFLLDKTGLSFLIGNKILKGDFAKMLPRVTGGHLQHEILLKAAGEEKHPDGSRSKAVDATAGLGEDSFLLAAGGFEVEMAEHNPITAALLADALIRAKKDPQLRDIVKYMTLKKGDSKEFLRTLSYRPDLVYLDPMYPEKKKNAESKKKLQVLHLIEQPCSDEEELVKAAVGAAPKKIVIKRPPDGPFLAGIKPSYSVTRSAVRFDCLVL